MHGSTKLPSTTVRVASLALGYLHELGAVELNDPIHAPFPTLGAHRALLGMLRSVTVPPTCSVTHPFTARVRSESDEE